MEKDGSPTYYAKNRKEWREWLAKYHDKEKSVWLIIYRKEGATPSVSYVEAVEEALCYGWIDSKGNKRDAESYYQFFARRNPKSKWSGLNKRRVAKLLQQNLMVEAGLKMVEIAQQNGSWTALDAVEQLLIPEDLQQALQQNQAAQQYFEAFPPSVKRGILEWILNAKRPETRQKRIAETVRLAAKNIRANQYRA